MANNFNFGNFRTPNFSPKPIRIKPIKIQPIKIKRNPQIFGKSFRETGKEFELRVRRELIKKGFKVSKAQNMHYDWLATRGKKKYAIECKCNKASFSQQEMIFSHQAKK